MSKIDTHTVRYLDTPSTIFAKSVLAIKDHLKVRYKYEMSSHSISAAQGLIMTLGLLGALWLGVYQVAYEGRSVGKFTTLLIYWAQLSGNIAQ